MAKITMMPGIASISGRVGNYSFRTMRATGKVYVRSMARKDPRPAKAPSAAQIAAKARFAKVVSAVRAILADPTEKAKLKAEYKAQTKIGSLFGYAMHKLNANYDVEGNKIGG